MRRDDALARHERAQHADTQIKVFNLGIVSDVVFLDSHKKEPPPHCCRGGKLCNIGIRNPCTSVREMQGLFE